MAQNLYNRAEEKRRRNYVYGNLNQVIVFFLYLAVSIGLFIFVLVYRIQQHTNWLVVIARISDVQLNLNCTLMIVLMLPDDGKDRKENVEKMSKRKT